MRRSAKRWIAAMFLVGCAVTLVKALLNEVFEDFKGRGEHESWSVEEARGRGVLVTELTPEPSELTFPDGRIRFGRAWIEERALPTHRFVWVPAEHRIGGYRLHFTLAEVTVVDQSDLFFVLGDEGRGAVVMSSGREQVYSWAVASPDIADLRWSAVRSWKELRPKNIRFVPKP